MKCIVCAHARRLLALSLGFSQSTAGAADGDADEKAIRELAGRFFDAYASKDVDACMALWSQQSPDYETHKKTMAGLFAQTGPIKVQSLTVMRVRRDGDAATRCIQCARRLAGDDLKTGKLHSSLGMLDCVLDLGRAGGAWKVLGYDSSDVVLIVRLAEANSKAERLRPAGRGVRSGWAPLGYLDTEGGPQTGPTGRVRRLVAVAGRRL